MNTNLSKFAYIDSLRGIAVILVFLIHITFFLPVIKASLPSMLETALALGQFGGVELFFIVSGFTLFRSFDIRSKIEENAEKNFMIRRFFRIAPAYYFALIVAFIASKFFPIMPIKFSNLICHLLFISTVNNNILFVEWTIFVEICFYIMLPFIFNNLFEYKKINLLLLITFIISVMTYFLPHKISIHLLPIKWFYIFIMGGLLYKYFKTYKIDNKYEGLLTLGTIFLLAIMLLANGNTIFNYFIYIFVSINMFLFFILIQNEKRNKLWNLLDNRFLRYIGKISFSIYLTHLLIIKYITMFIIYNKCPFFGIWAFISISLFAFILSVIISHIMFKTIEEPAINFSKKLISQKFQISDITKKIVKAEY